MEASYDAHYGMPVSCGNSFSPGRIQLIGGTWNQVPSSYYHDSRTKEAIEKPQVIWEDELADLR